MINSYLWFSLRRQRKAEENVGISLNNALAPPGLSSLYIDDDEPDTGFGAATPSPRRTAQKPRALSPGRTPQTPITPTPRRKAYANNKPATVDASVPSMERVSLAPKRKEHKQHMDLARAMGIMGFSSSRWLDASQVRLNRKSFWEFENFYQK